MLKNQLKAAVVGALIVFVWMVFSWMVFPWHQQTMNKFTNESRVADVIRDNAPVKGIYILPNTMCYNESTSQHEMTRGMRMMENGPFMFAAVSPQGVGKMTLKPFILTLIIQFIGAFIVCWMLSQTKGLKLRKQVEFVAMFGLGIGVLSQLTMWNWWGFPAGFVFVHIVDFVIAWLLAGFGIAKVLKGRD